MSGPGVGTEQYEGELIRDIGGFTHDPLGYVLYSFPWGEGDLREKYVRVWQRGYLEDLGRRLVAGEEPGAALGAILKAVSSGHGVGKSALVAWLILWGLSTCEDTRIIVTANTEGQLKNKTWAELAKWHRLSINGHWFTFTATSLYSNSPGHDKIWRADMMPWSEDNPEAFAGLHNEGKRILVIMDEASAIADKIWEVTEGALTDANTEIMWLVFGNPTRNSGRFFECFGSRRHRWWTLNLDARTVEGTNLALFAEWVQDWGEDSDFVRVRVKGLFPRASSLQFIDSDSVAQAQTREAVYLKGDPLILALDVARGGDDECVFRFRRGRDARTIAPVKIPGSEVKDSMKLVSVAVELCEKHKPDYFFYDETGVGGPVGDRVRQLGYVVMGVMFSAASPDKHQANMRAYIWYKCREWLRNGGAIDKDTKLATDLTSVQYGHNAKDQLLLEPKDAIKKRGLASPDDGDALCMTFAFTVQPKDGPGFEGAAGQARGRLQSEWDPFEEARL